MSDYPRPRAANLWVNVLSNLTANVWLAALAFAAIPFIYRAIGPSQYAIVGMYLLALQWSTFLDLGLSPALARFAAQQNSPGQGFARVRYLLAWFEPLTLLLAAALVGVGTSTYSFSPRLLHTWTASPHASLELVILILTSMALRLVSNLYRAGLTGLEFQTQVSLINAVSTSVRMGFPVALALINKLGLLEFFYIQLLAGAFEVFCFRTQLIRRVGSVRLRVERKQLIQNFKLGVSVAGLGVFWVISSQIDKLTLSSKLSLEEFGSFVLATQLASFVTLITGAIQTAVLPRITKLYAAQDTRSVAQSYVLSGLTCISLGFASSFAFYVCGDSILNLFVSDAHALPGLKIVVCVYALSNGLVGVAAMAYALQNAAGVLKWHWRGIILSTLIQIPLFFFLAQEGNMSLIAIAYLGTRFLYITLWLAIAHNLFLRPGHWQWLRQVFLLPALACMPIGFGCLLLFASEAHFLAKLAQGVLTFLLILASSALANKVTRQYLSQSLLRDA